MPRISMCSRRLTRHQASGDVWGACADFAKHLSWHEPRLVILGPKTETLPEDHPPKPECLFQLSQLFQRVGNHTERKRLLTHILKLARERGDDRQLTRTLRHLSRVHLAMGLCEEGIRQAREASEVSERLGDAVETTRYLIELAWPLHHDKGLGATEKVASCAINPLPEEGEQFQDVERAKLHAADDHDAYLPGCAMKLQARLWHGQNRLGGGGPGRCVLLTRSRGSGP